MMLLWHNNKDRRKRLLKKKRPNLQAEQDTKTLTGV